MKKLFVITLLHCLAVVSLNSQDIVALSGGVQMRNSKGRLTEFSNILKNNDNIMIISFWATWCKPCIQELDYLNDTYDELSQEMDVTVYAISIDDARSRKRVLPLINGKGWEFEVLIDENSELKRKLNVINVPHTFIVDRNKRIIYEHTSYVPGDEEEYLKIIEGLK